MFTLKDYQNRALTALSRFLVEARTGSVAEAFEQSYVEQDLPPVPYRHYDFGEMPVLSTKID